MGEPGHDVRSGLRPAGTAPAKTMVVYAVCLVALAGNDVPVTDW